MKKCMLAWGLVLGFFAALTLASSVSYGKNLATIDGKPITEDMFKKAIERLKLKQAFSKMGFKLDFAALIGWLVKWFLLVVFFIATADILGLSQITGFLNSVVLYIPNVIIAVVVILLGIIIGSFTGEVVQKAVKASKMHTGEVMGGIAKWAIVVFAFMAALMQLGIASAMIQTLFTGLVAMLAIAGGLAFGLGGRDVAEEILGVLKKDLTKKRK